MNKWACWFLKRGILVQPVCGIVSWLAYAAKAVKMFMPFGLVIPPPRIVS